MSYDRTAKQSNRQTDRQAEITPLSAKMVNLYCIASLFHGINFITRPHTFKTLNLRVNQKNNNFKREREGVGNFKNEM